MSRGVVGVAAALSFGVVAGVATAQQSVFRTGTDLVHLAVTVTDRDGTPLTDLTADDFEILEDGVPQALVQFARSGEADAPPLHLGLLLDTSESMVADLALSQTAAIRFLNRVPEAVDLTLVSVDAEVRVSRFSQDDFPRLVERIRSSTSGGYTALYDAFALYLDGAATDDGRTILVAFTDGGDSRSALSFGDVVEIVRASNATIYVVGLIDHARSDMRTIQRVRLTRIAEESGGQAIFPTSMRQIEAAYDRILAELRGRYSLGYISSNPRRDGTWRKVTIRMASPDRKDMRIRSRGGYFAWRDAEP